MNNIDKYLQQEDINHWLNLVGNTNKDRIVRKLNQDNSNDILNIFAVIDELKIGAFLSEIGVAVVYDYKIGSKTPDWFDKINNTIIEVRGINQTGLDLKRQRFEEKLQYKIEQIAGSFTVEISFDSQAEAYFYESYDLDNYLNLFSKWYIHNQDSGLIFSKDNIEIKLQDCISELSKFEVACGNINLIKCDSRRLLSVLEKKIENYKTIIEDNDLSFIIAIVCDIRNGLRKIDFQTILYGASIEDRIRQSNYSKLEGLFYNEKYKTLLSGVLFLNRGDKPIFFKNCRIIDNELIRRLNEYAA